VGANPARGYSSLHQHCWIVIGAVVYGKISSRTKRMCSSGLDGFFVYTNEREGRLNGSLNTAVQTNAMINLRNEVSGKPHPPDSFEWHCPRRRRFSIFQERNQIATCKSGGIGGCVITPFHRSSRGCCMLLDEHK
jgi:hypothetical protein